jgi:glycerophosphoryl diester phosphodiesterase
MISAHDLGARQARAGATASVLLHDALELPVDYVEFDVQRTVDGEFVLQHDHHVVVAGELRPVAKLTLSALRQAVPGLVTYDEALQRVRGHAKAHLDFKFGSPGKVYAGPDSDTWEVQATARAVEVLGPDQFVVTSGRLRGIAAIRRWAQPTYPNLLVGISIGRSRAGQPLARQLAGRWSELFPWKRIEASGANLIVANRWLATFGLARLAARQGLPLLVWTVDDRRGLRR